MLQKKPRERRLRNPWLKWIRWIWCYINQVKKRDMISHLFCYYDKDRLTFIIFHPYALWFKDYFLPGRAEALGTICRVLCSKQCREEVLAPYLARCYAAIHRGLKDSATAASVVLNAYDIFRWVYGALVLWLCAAVLSCGYEVFIIIHCLMKL